MRLCHTPGVTADRAIRVALWCSVALNLLGAALFGAAAVGYPPALVPLTIAPFYAAQLALSIGIFAGVYGWLACQRVIDRPLLFVGALGKLGFFALFIVYCAAGDLPSSSVAQASPDFVLGAVYLWWLRVTAGTAPPALAQAAGGR